MKLTEMGKATLQDRYLMANETFEDLFNRVCKAYSDNDAHQNRLKSYIEKMWFMPATPILANGGTNRGLPISCFLNEMQDSFDSIAGTLYENMYLAKNGGGIGTNLTNIRSIGEKITNNGETGGVIPFAKIIDSMSLGISQGGNRRGSTAVYMDISHPEIEEFIDIRRPTGGDPNRRSLNIHHGITITNKFMQAVENGEKWNLVSPQTKEIIKIVDARELWIKILNARIEVGEPYIIFIDTVNSALPQHQKQLGLNVKMSNLCSEITLPTGLDHLGKERTAVCCLSSLNLEKWDEWNEDKHFIEDIMRFLDNVLQDFINRAPDFMSRAKYSAMRERSVGLGVMGFHSFLQSKNVSIESVVAKSWNKKIFKHIKEQCDASSIKLAQEKGACPDAKECGIMERFSNKIAIAPTASISIICGNSSPGIEPFSANVFTVKSLSGSFIIKNKNLENLLESKGLNNDDVWNEIARNGGSIQNLDCFTQYEKEIYKTAIEINQKWLIEHAADRAPYVCQAQSLNLFLPANISKKELHQIHFDAWKKGIKSLYYCRSQSIQKAQVVSGIEIKSETKNYEECLSCQ